MRDFRLFIREKSSDTGNDGHFAKGGGQPRHLAMFSDFFSSTDRNMFTTNSMYAGFRNELIDTVDVLSPSEDVIVDIYERKVSDAEARELTLIGFRRYLAARCDILRRESLYQLANVSVFALLGLLLVILSYTLETHIPNWCMYCINTVGTVLLWQFVGYWAFEHFPTKRKTERLKQLGRIRFEFHEWN